MDGPAPEDDRRHRRGGLAGHLQKIAAAGFKAVEVWEAHAAPEALDEAKARLWKRILDDNGLTPVAYAGGLRPETLRMCQWLGIPHCDGGLRENTPEKATALCREHGVRFNIENHPEKSAQEILAKIGGGNEWLGVCIDTGWLGTQGAPGPATIKACAPFVRHVHIKDVKAAGKHETCLLGEGSADVAGCMAALREIQYGGWYSWEDEPEDRNPMALGGAQPRVDREAARRLGTLRPTSPDRPRPRTARGAPRGFPAARRRDAPAGRSGREASRWCRSAG